MVETIGSTTTSFCVSFLKKWFITKPRIIGTRIIWMILINIALTSTSTVVLNNKYVIAGVNIGASNVFTLVMHTEKATSPLEK